MEGNKAQKLADLPGQPPQSPGMSTRLGRILQPCRMKLTELACLESRNRPKRHKWGCKKFRLNEENHEGEQTLKKRAQKGCGSTSLAILKPWLDVAPSSLPDIRPTLKHEAGLRDFHSSLPTYMILLFSANLWASSQSKHRDLKYTRIIILQSHAGQLTHSQESVQMGKM